jgi:hypothetical protein
MIGADFESVRGEWGVRGELAAFVSDNFQSPDLRIVRGSSIDAGVGVDRRAGDYTISATVLAHSESYDEPLSAVDPRDGRSDVSFVFSTDRTFARERYRLRGFGVTTRRKHPGSCAPSASRACATMSRSKGRSAGSRVSGAISSAGSATAIPLTSGDITSEIICCFRLQPEGVDTCGLPASAGRIFF